MAILARPFDVPERPVDPPWVSDPEPDDDSDDLGGDPDLSHAGAATEPLTEFHPVAYRRASRRAERARFRRLLVKAFLLGVAVGVVGFSICMEAWA